jgi:hypothetical protein
MSSRISSWDKIPSSKLQIPKKFQASDLKWIVTQEVATNANDSRRLAGRVLNRPEELAEARLELGIWILGFGAF